VWGQIIGEVVGVALSWKLANWRPTWEFDRQVTREVLIFGGHIIIVEFVGALRSNVDYLIIGRVLGASALGLYTMAYRFPELAIRSMNHVVGRVSFPLLSIVQSDKESLRNFYFGYIRYIALFTFPVGFGLALISNLFVEVFLSEEWARAIVPMALISIALAISSVGYVPGVLYKSINRPEILNRVSLIKLPFIVAIVLYATRWDIVGVSIGQIAFAIFSVTLDSVVVSQVVEFRMSEMLKSLAPAAIATGAMTVVVGLLQIALAPDGWIGLVGLVLAGVTTYILALSLVQRPIIVQAYTALRGVLVRS
jgi:O-antigen/teichoic acid export membrane protein